MKIGDVKTWVIESNAPDTPGARQEARRLQSLIDKGIDPRIEKQERLRNRPPKELNPRATKSPLQKSGRYTLKIVNRIGVTDTTVTISKFPNRVAKKEAR